MQSMHRIQKNSQGKLYISYNKNQWNKNVEKYMDIDYKKKKEINNLMKGNMQRHVTKKCNVCESLISTFIFVKEPFKKDDVQKKRIFGMPWI
jgi:hypothetical protein